MQTIPLDIQADADHAIVWANDRLYLLDQRVLPAEESYLELQSAEQTATAISDMVVRGAPAIGITAAFGVVLAGRRCYAEFGGDWKSHIHSELDTLAASRPTAVNLFWALKRMKRLIADMGAEDPVPSLLSEARKIHEEDIAANRTMGEFGAGLIEGPTSVITHCNAGALATGGYGTALGVIRSAHAAGKIEMVYADETRPWLQGSRLTAWELARDNIPVTLLTDGAAASRMAWGGVGWIIVGSDRIAANGDVANKIGTYSLAVAARHHGVKVMVAAPTSTIDMNVASGADIPIESRDPAEVLCCGGRQVGAADVPAWNPVFDVTPAALVDAIVTEKGVVRLPDTKKMADLMT
ncbi:S-methyl-5-thioribose-1-phosphate isomerase [Solemya velesiana gill symbiont]|uniref:Methylthioribose-1-phosphate isomerase n=1 Tax=Solemya velesiana gill symbiont TaxID=1918948 RepID=A0A1T2KU74_9GAMM|nr:S-methyl-5-thioribose-1-phosphate isomerase [Solemya velesiana gill symbiont]OOZ36341.1 S-methyl-5-thioribose-1-phosphate isomerase [Solemya velesiana gill symbiont]